MYIRTIKENGRYTVHYDIGGIGDQWPEVVRKEFAAALHHRLQKIDPEIPLYQNGVWTPRRKRLSLPLGEILTKKRHIYAAILYLLSTVVDMGVYRDRSV